MIRFFVNELLSFLSATCFCCFLGGKFKLMMLLQAAMIVKSLPKYMYMYCPALSSNICLPIKMLRNAITKDKGMYGSF